MIPLISYFQYQELIERTEEEKGGKQYQNDLDTVKQILEKCKTGGKRISLTKDERSWLRQWLEDKRRTIIVQVCIP